MRVSFVTDPQTAATVRVLLGMPIRLTYVSTLYFAAPNSHPVNWESTGPVFAKFSESVNVREGFITRLFILLEGRCYGNQFCGRVEHCWDYLHRFFTIMRPFFLR